MPEPPLTRTPRRAVSVSQGAAGCRQRETFPPDRGLSDAPSARQTAGGECGLTPGAGAGEGRPRRTGWEQTLGMGDTQGPREAVTGNPRVAGRPLWESEVLRPEGTGLRLAARTPCPQGLAAQRKPRTRFERDVAWGAGRLGFAGHHVSAHLYSGGKACREARLLGLKLFTVNQADRRAGRCTVFRSAQISPDQ